MRLAYDAAGAAAAFRRRPRLRPRARLAVVAAGAGRRPGRARYRHVEDQVYRRTAGTGSGAPGLLALEGDDFEAFLEVWRDSWGPTTRPTGREEASPAPVPGPAQPPFRTGDGGGVLLLFDSGTTTQLCHFAVRRSAQGRVGRRMLELARGLVPAGRPLWLFTAAGGSADRAAAGAGWDLDHTATDWILDLGPPGAASAPRTPELIRPTLKGPAVQLGRLDHVGVAVADLAAARALYEQVLGLEVTHEEVIEDQACTSCCSAQATPFVQLVAPLSPTPRWAASWPGGARASTTSAMPSPTSPPPWPTSAPRASR